MNILGSPRKENKITTSWLYIALCCLFCSLYFARDIWHINISYYVVYAVAAITILTVRQTEAVAFFISISAFTGAGFDGLFSMLLFGCMLLRFCYYLKRVKLFSVMLVLMCIYEVLHYFAATNTALGTIITYVMVLASLLIVQQCPYNTVDKELVVNSFIAFSLFFVMMTLIQMIDAFGSLKALLESGYRTSEYSELREIDALSANQNYITSLCSLNLCLCVLMLSKKMPKLFYIAAFAIFLVSGLLTVSKMFFVVIVAFAVYVSIMAFKQSLLKGIGVVVLMILAGVLILWVTGDSLIDMVFYRFETEDLTTGRTDIVGELLVYMREHPQTYFFGAGIIQVHYLLSGGIHSSFFEVIGGWGIPGLVMVFYYIAALVAYARRESVTEGSKPNGYNYLPLLMYLGYSLIGMLFGSAFAVVKLMVCIYAIGIKERGTNAVQHHNAGV